MIVYGDRRERLSPALALLRLRGCAGPGRRPPGLPELARRPPAHAAGAQGYRLVQQARRAGRTADRGRHPSSRPWPTRCCPTRIRPGPPHAVLRLTDLAAEAVAHSLTTHRQADHAPCRRRSGHAGGVRRRLAMPLVDRVGPALRAELDALGHPTCRLPCRPSCPKATCSTPSTPRPTCSDAPASLLGSPAQRRRS